MCKKASVVKKIEALRSMSGYKTMESSPLTNILAKRFRLVLLEMGS